MPLIKSNAKRSPRLALQNLEFAAIGTQWRITIAKRMSRSALDVLKEAVFRRIAQFDMQYSRFRTDSLVSAMTEKTGTYQLPDDAKPLFDLYEQLYERTGGAVTPLIGQALSDAGYDAQYSFIPKRMHPTPTWDQALVYAFPTLTIKRPVLLDVGAAGKGYLVDIIADIIEASGITEFCVNAGGDMTQRGSQAETVGLEHPGNSEQVIGVATLQNRSLCGSAGNRRTWDGYHHILHPRSHLSPQAVRAVWVVAESTLLADGLTTALFFTEARLLHKWYNFEYAMVMEDYSLTHSAGFPAEFFTERRAV
ncbi:MAG TPA: FAD:protein FMN transferase [Patescibacteria group bacterium]|nr:FAD:protein FMN transferase [Patescibacteria group bacterium]